MPLSELWKFTTGKLESRQQRSFPADRAKDDLVELVWENGQILKQSQSNRGTESPGLKSIPSNTNRVRDVIAGQPLTSKTGKLGGVESILDEMSSVVPSGELDLSQDGEMDHWLNYPAGDGLSQGYVSDVLPKISGVTANGFFAQKSFVSMEKRSNCDENVNSFSSGGNVLKALSSKARPLFSWSAQHCQSSDAMGSGVSNWSNNNPVNGHNSPAAFRNAPRGKAMVNESASMEMGRPEMGQPTSNSNFLNFPYFSRPAIITKSKPRYCDGTTTSISSGVVKIDVKDRDSASGGNLVKYPLVSPRKVIDFGPAASNFSMVDPRKQAVEESKEIRLPERAENVSKEPSIKNEKLVISGHVACPTKETLDHDRNVEATFVSSSVGSGYSADRASNGCTHNSKRTFHDIEESDCRSDDIKIASVGVKKTTPARIGSNSKRSRATEVHNLSERRRRDRINEKMHALQELIPNCNKVDKASTLDEAIEYLKTLQLQVQIMSMGAGLCMPPPMMLPTGMQHMHPSHLPQFSAMGFGMGMGMEFGMGFRMRIRDMGGGSPGYPIFPVPNAQVAHFPPMSGPSNLQRIPVPNLPAWNPCPGLLYSVPRAPTVLVAAQPPVASGTVLCGLSENPNDLPESDQSEGRSFEPAGCSARQWSPCFSYYTN